MTRALRALVLVVLLALGSTTFAAGSFAGTDYGWGGTFTIENGSSSESGCADIDYEFSTDDYYFGWSFEGEITDPSGSSVDGIYLYDDGGESGSTTLCADFDRAGTYTVTGEFSSYDVNYDPVIEGSSFTTTFKYTIRHPAPTAISTTKRRTHVNACPGRANAHCWEISAHATKSGKGWSGRKLELQGYSSYYQVISTCTTNFYGNCKFRVQAKTRRVNTINLRVHADGNANARAANSPTFRIRY